ncbi:hypothetical protein SAMN05660477_00622 [Soonwooa buanensis]|uniref:Uncharacterized protein n=1 Tax=Soonwooa buanensis TaxID=619805 RepID=A0A1T5D4I1_9FLAO|nr:hypothetical protein [Soonwooa buanensis]SKB66668.1 hypothetical protein SAMN05660477_00622 [Soonwooa buanensis]
MLSELENNFVQLEKKIVKLHKTHISLLDKYAELSKDYKQLQEEFDEEKKRNRVLAEEQKDLKLYSAISGNADHNKLMKNHLNKLIKEVDFCIAELRNSGL